MTVPESLVKQKYINLTTFRKNGKAVPTPVWFVIQDNKLYVYTYGTSGKAKRIRANGKAQIAPSDWRGNPLAAFVPARARVIPQDDPIWEKINRLYAKKYGLMYHLFQWAERMRKNPQDQHVILELVMEN